jgi:AraC-like DNA-binding protein
VRELLFKTAEFPDLYPMGGKEERTIDLLLEELSAARMDGFYFPMPAELRLRELAEMMRAAPADNSSLAEWAKRTGMSERTMTRLLRDEIGMSFGRWRRQLHIVLALQLLSQGETVQAIAIELGYESASGFVTMFRKAVGKPPAKFLADCHERDNGR